MRSFGSDNHSGIHPQILAAITAANSDHDFAYGDDAVTTRATKALQALFGGEPDVYFVFNGTGANLLALKTLTRSFNAIVCAGTAHICVDECGAPEALTGCKLLAIDTPDGKLTPELVRTLPARIRVPTPRPAQSDLDLSADRIGHALYRR